MASIALASATSSNGFDWRALIVGAVLTLAAQALIQLVVVPHVDTRRRREARWEEDVLRLGELLTEQLPGAARELRHADWWLGTVLTTRATSPEAHDRLVREAKRKLDPIDDRWSELQVRLGWLTERVTYLVRGHPRLRTFAVAVEAYLTQARGAHVTGVLVRHSEPPVFDADMLDRRWADEAAARAELLAVVKELVRDAPPRRSRIREKVEAVRPRRRRSSIGTKVG